jgi:exodeoxyribonuclease VII small subunit
VARTERTSTEKPEPTYDELVSRLEAVVGELEGGELSLERSVERFAEGIELARAAARRLDQAEARVAQLVRSDEGEVEAPLDAERGG